MPKIGIIGERDAILGFKALGISTFPVKSPNEAETKLCELIGADYGSIFITESYAKPLAGVISELEREIPLYPSIVIIPNHEGSKTLGMKKIKSIIEKAIGIDIFSV